MEIKKEDLAMFKTFEDKFFVAFKPSVLDEKPKIPEVVEEVIDEIKKTAEELEAERLALEKAEKIAKLKKRLEELEAEV